MCDNDEGLVIFVVAFFQKMDDFLAVFAVQAAGRFIGKHDGGGIHQSAADGDTLLLASGQLVRQMCFALLQAKEL